MRVSIVGIALLLAAQSVPAQVRTADPLKRGLQLSDFPRLVKLSDNVYGYEEIRAPGFTTVSLIVVGRDGVLIADGQGNAQATRTLLDRVRTVTSLPIRWYVVGSDHGDHTAGNSVLPKDITYIVHPTSRQQLQRDSTAAAAANARAAAAAASSGSAAPNPRVVIVPPSAMSGDQQVIDIGGTQVQVVFLGRAHTGGDLSVHLPREKILFMSEAFLNRVFPAMRSAYPSEWVRTMDRALAMDVERYIPGHGFIEDAKTSREELVAFKAALQAVIAESTRLHKLGLSVEDAVRQANWGPYQDWFLREQQAPVAIRRVYDEIEGKLR
ncbi:MAG: MBL fold metallo-hydrolase [Gemmatimonadota bacterium]